LLYNFNNSLHLYSTFSETSKRFTYGRGESPQPPPMCCIHTWMMRRQPYCTRMPHTHQLIGVMKPI